MVFFKCITKCASWRQEKMGGPFIEEVKEQGPHRDRGVGMNPPPCFGCNVRLLPDVQLMAEEII